MVINDILSKLIVKSYSCPLFGVKIKVKNKAIFDLGEVKLGQLLTILIIAIPW